ncbi:unnamed protein product, partial [Auanema sp. JU1783]
SPHREMQFDAYSVRLTENEEHDTEVQPVLAETVIDLSSSFNCETERQTQSRQSDFEQSNKDEETYGEAREEQNNMNDIINSQSQYDESHEQASDEDLANPTKVAILPEKTSIEEETEIQEEQESVHSQTQETNTTSTSEYIGIRRSQPSQDEEHSSDDQQRFEEAFISSSTSVLNPTVDIMAQQTIENQEDAEEKICSSHSPVSSEIHHHSDVYSAHSTQNEESHIENTDSPIPFSNEEQSEKRHTEGEPVREETNVSFHPVSNWETEPKADSGIAAYEQNSAEDVSDIAENSSEADVFTEKHSTVSEEENENIVMTDESQTTKFSEPFTSHVIEASEYGGSNPYEEVKDEVMLPESSDTDVEDSSVGFGDRALSFAKKAGAIAGAAVVAPVGIAALGAKAAYEAIKEHGQSSSLHSPEDEYSQNGIDDTMNEISQTSHDQQIVISEERFQEHNYGPESISDEREKQMEASTTSSLDEERLEFGSESDRKNDLITTTTVPAILDTLESSNVEAGN